MRRVVRQDGRIVRRDVYRCGEGSAFLSVRDHDNGFYRIPGIHLRIHPSVAEWIKEFERSRGVCRSVAWRNYYCNQADKYKKGAFSRLRDEQMKKAFIEEHPFAALILVADLATIREIERGERGSFWRLVVDDFLTKTHKATHH